MKTQSDNAFITDWQICSYVGSEMDKHRETDGIEEEIENGFFNFGREDYKNPNEDGIRTKKSR